MTHRPEENKLRYFVRRPDDGCPENQLIALVITDTYEEALAWCEEEEAKEEKFWSEEREEDGTLCFPNGFKYDEPFYEIVDIWEGEIVRKGVC